MLSILLAAPLLVGGADTDPFHQFDFWLGEWSVQNRHFRGGEWVDGTRTRARITPVCGGRAVLEEWAGPLNGAFMNGFSLRAYDPELERWALLLFWTTNGDGGFGRLTGRFRHGRGEFFSSWRDAQGVDVTQRYSFSDALPDTVRWDSATTRDGGASWATDWIMEFSRTRAAEEVTQDRLFATAWTEGSLSRHPEARRLDWLLGAWAGTQTELSSDEEREARLHCKLLDKDCLVLELLETRDAGAPDWDERLAVRGWSAQARAWEGWSLSEDDTRLRQARGTLTADAARFEGAPQEGVRRIETWRRVADDVVVLEEEELAPGEDEPRLVRITELTRAPEREEG